MLKRTSQSIVVQTEALQVDALEQLARNCACQRMLSHKVRRGRHKVRRGRLAYQLGRFPANCNKVIFAQRPLVNQSGRFSTNCNKVIFARKSNHGELSKRVQNRRKWKRTGQLVAVETKVSQVDELAEFGGD